MSRRVSWLELSAILIAAGCSESSMNGLDGKTSLVRIEIVAPGEQCAAGGLSVSTGIDSNSDGVLSDSEVQSTKYICNGATGQDGKNALLETEIEPAGVNCPAGGFVVKAGLDEDSDGVLDPEEVSATRYVCHGEAGVGRNSLVHVQGEPAGANCEHGGQAIRAGTDTNGDGLLQPEEVESTSYICNGAPGASGADGLNALVRQEDAAPSDCDFGGRLVHNGLDLDGDGYLDTDEIQQTAAVCNGEPGVAGYDSLFALEDVPAGSECSAGGFRVQTGLDTNRNGVLDTSEVTATKYICHGEAGAGGDAGADGLDSLVSTTEEPAGTNCPAGGTQVQSGLDANRNGVLDPAEVSSTRYVCNGSDGLNSLVATAAEPAGSICPAGGFKVQTGLDNNRDGVLDTSEVTATRYVCHGAGMVMRASNADWGGVCQRGGVMIETGVDDNGNNVLDDSEVDQGQYVCNVYLAQITVGVYHTCALISDGTARCWGRNNQGQLGDGTATNRHTPVTVTGLSDAAEISAGGSHTCTRQTDGTARCWGSNSNGQLGDGTTTQRTTPVTVTGLSGIAEISAGDSHTCTRHTAGTARCWGRNEQGQLGDGTTTNRSTPVTVTGLSGVAEISAGQSHTCTRQTDGTAKCWGDNFFGQLGDWTYTDRIGPVTVTGPSGMLLNVAEISAGAYHTCTRQTDGTAKCWGHNSYGQLGDGTTTNRNIPSTVTGLSDVAEISTFGGVTCTRQVAGTANCWGQNDLGQLGDGTTTNRSTPVTVTGLSGVAEISAGYFHSCASHTDGTARCWGNNYNGQLGDGTTTDSLTPVTIPGFGDSAP